MALTVEDIAALLRLIESSGLEEVEIEVGGTRLLARRGGAATAAAAATGPRAVVSATGLPAARRAVAAASAHVPSPVTPLPRPTARNQPARAPTPGLVTVNAPMVGSFFRRPAPDQPMFVEIGQRVLKGQALCLIEVMKLYTTIEAPADGVVEQILVEDGQLVDYDQPLVAIRVAAQAAS